MRNKRLNILHIDDEEQQFKPLVSAFKSNYDLSAQNDDITEEAIHIYSLQNKDFSINIYGCQDKERALYLVNHKKLKFDIIFIDFKMPEENGAIVGQELYTTIFNVHNYQPYLIMLTGYGETAVETLRSGVFSDYIRKDEIKIPQEFLGLITRFERYQESELKRIFAEKRADKAEKQILDYASILSELQKALEVDLEKFTDEHSELKGNSDELIQIRWFIDLYSKVEIPVLILGETGTGKELVAKEIHKKSNRKSKELEIINCAAIPETLIESELFGAKAEGASGITKDRKGAFERAHGSTLFLDEFGDMSTLVQVKVLRAIENGEILPVGGTKIINVDVRVICATSLKLKEKAGEDFRIDLFYRVGGLFPEIPPLKKRKRDIHSIYKNFIERKRFEYYFFSPDALEALIDSDYEWPGNVRELLKFFEHTTAIFPNVRFDKTKALKLLELWKTHQPVKNLTNRIVEQKTTKETIQTEGEDIPILDYEIEDLVNLLDDFLSTYETLEQEINRKKRPTIPEIESILKPSNKSGWLTTYFSKIDKRKVIKAINDNPKLDRLKTIPPVKKHFK
jgi:transcriptional regulator with PAS, ATPase and Fis domain